MNKYKLCYSEGVTIRNKVGILADCELREEVIEVCRINDWMMTIKLVIGGSTLNMASALDMIEKFLVVGALGSSNDADNMLFRTSS